MFKGKAWKYGDDVDTDVIIPARYLTSFDPEVLKTHCMEDLDSAFAGKVSAGDLIVAGNNFGCGSSREHAPLAIKGAGVSCVIAKSFARIFFRNSFNIGLPILESDEAVAGIDSGDEVEADLTTGKIVNLTKSAEYQARPAPEFMRELVAAGGLIEYAKKRLSEKKPAPAKVEKVEEAPKGPGARMKELEEEAPEAGRDAPWVDEEPTPTPTEDQRLEAEEDDDDE